MTAKNRFKNKACQKVIIGLDQKKLKFLKLKKVLFVVKFKQCLYSSMQSSTGGISLAHLVL